MKTLTDPYTDVEDVTKMTVRVSIPDWVLLKNCRPFQGNIQETLGTLINRLCNELRTKNITDFTGVEQYEELINNVRFGDGGTLDRSGSETDVRNDDGRTSSPRAKAKRVKTKLS